jgi:hypothetical protein
MLPLRNRPPVLLTLTTKNGILPNLLQQPAGNPPDFGPQRWLTRKYDPAQLAHGISLVAIVEIINFAPAIEPCQSAAGGI